MPLTTGYFLPHSTQASPSATCLSSLWHERQRRMLRTSSATPDQFSGLPAIFLPAPHLAVSSVHRYGLFLPSHNRIKRRRVRHQKIRIHTVFSGREKCADHVRGDAHPKAARESAHLGVRRVHLCAAGHLDIAQRPVQHEAEKDGGGSSSLCSDFGIAFVRNMPGARRNFEIARSNSKDRIVNCRLDAFHQQFFTRRG